MPDRTSSSRTTPRTVTLAIDVVLLTPRGSELAVLLAPGDVGKARGRERWTLPSDTLRGEESLDEAAARIARDAAGAAPSFLDQAATLGGAQLTVTYFGLVPDAGGGARRSADWVGLSELPALGVRHREEIEVAMTAMRARVDQHPIAFRLLPAAFTLSELQAVYELLLGRRLHKASFRRSLHASALVEATDEWRSEGRGRPAQLFRYAPPRRRRQRRGIRFDLLG
ncbi:MAG: family hydrolase [Gemmatimonadetes bacterium]|nr:family hydrolase [Gemmatimonadota bacterium]